MYSREVLRNKIDVAEMRMLRWIWGHTRKYSIRNQELRERLGLALLSAKLRENILRWFGRVKRANIDALMRVAKGLIVEGNRN